MEALRVEVNRRYLTASNPFVLKQISRVPRSRGVITPPWVSIDPPIAFILRATRKSKRGTIHKVFSDRLISFYQGRGWKVLQGRRHIRTAKPLFSFKWVTKSPLCTQQVFTGEPFICPCVKRWCLALSGQRQVRWLKWLTGDYITSQDTLFKLDRMCNRRSDRIYKWMLNIPFWRWTYVPWWSVDNQRPCELMSCCGGSEYSKKEQEWDRGLFEWTDGACVAWEGLKSEEAPSATSSVLLAGSWPLLGSGT